MQLLNLEHTKMISAGNAVEANSLQLPQLADRLKMAFDLTLSSVEWLPYAWGAGLLICGAPISGIPAGLVTISGIIYWSNCRYKISA